MMKCRSCDHQIANSFLYLGHQPLSNSYIEVDSFLKAEMSFPLTVYFCEKCHLVQLDEFEAPENIFDNYKYFSSFSSSWLKHASEYVDHICEREKLGPKDFIVEIASNDGYLLQFFKKKEMPILGVEPAHTVAEKALEAGIPTLVRFFGAETGKKVAEDYQKAKLICANNVLAHVPNINDFVAGFKALLREDGLITFEFPHLLSMMKLKQFDTIYHEHFSYLSLLALQHVFARHDLEMFDVEKLGTHGGSLRLYVAHKGVRPTTQALANVISEEKQFGLDREETFRSYAKEVLDVKIDFLKFLFEVRSSGKKICAYGAPAKGNTFLNYCGVLGDLIPFTVDKNTHKQGTFLPGSHIPVKSLEDLRKENPDYILILPWNLKNEIIEDLKSLPAKFVTAIPWLEIH